MPCVVSDCQCVVDMFWVNVASHFLLVATVLGVVAR